MAPSKSQTVWSEAAAAELPREEKILHYAPLVNYIVKRITSRLPPHVPREDLLHYGVLGLIDAIDKFDPGKGIKFRTYAEFRIRGSVLDGLRSMDWVPRSVRQKASRLEQAYGQLEQQMGREPTDEEMAEEMSLELGSYHELLEGSTPLTLLSLEEMGFRGDDPDRQNLLDRIADPDDRQPWEQLELVELRRIVAEAVGELSEQERLVISLYYHEELTMKEVGEVLGVTESRVSQVHSRALLRLRNKVRRRQE